MIWIFANLKKKDRINIVCIEIKLMSKILNNLRLLGNLQVDGNTTYFDSENVSIADNYLFLNKGYTTATAQSGGIVMNNIPTSTADTSNGSFVAGVAAVSNPTIATTGATTFAQYDIIQIDGTSGTNDGLYEVESHAANVLTIRGVGTVTTLEAFTQTQLTATSFNGATITKVSVAVLRFSLAGDPEISTGSSTGAGGFTYTSLTGNAIDHGSVSGLLDDDHTQYALLAGRSGGQTLIGSTLTSQGISITANSADTTGKVTVTGTDASTTPSTGAFVVTGGVGVGGDVQVGGKQTIGGTQFVTTNSRVGGTFNTDKTYTPLVGSPYLNLNAENSGNQASGIVSAYNAQVVSGSGNTLGATAYTITTGTALTGLATGDFVQVANTSTIGGSCGLYEVDAVTTDQNFTVKYGGAEAKWCRPGSEFGTQNITSLSVTKVGISIIRFSTSGVLQHATGDTTVGLTWQLPLSSTLTKYATLALAAGTLAALTTHFSAGVTATVGLPSNSTGTYNGEQFTVVNNGGAVCTVNSSEDIDDVSSNTFAVADSDRIAFIGANNKWFTI
jgi:hypothetical protein